MRSLLVLLLWSVASPVWACTFGSPELLAYKPDPRHTLFVGRVVGYVEDTTRYAGFEQHLVPLDSSHTTFRMVEAPTGHAWGVEYEVLEIIQAPSPRARYVVFPSTDVDGGCRPLAMDRYTIQAVYPLSDTVLVVSNGRYQPGRPWADKAEAPSAMPFALAEDKDYDGAHHRQGVFGFSVKPFSAHPDSTAALQHYISVYTPYEARARVARDAYMALSNSDEQDAAYNASSNLARMNDSLSVVATRGYVEMRRDLALLERASSAVQRRWLVLKLRRYWYDFTPYNVEALPREERRRMTRVNEEIQTSTECAFAYLVQRHARSRTERQMLDQALREARLRRVRSVRGCPAPLPEAMERGIGSASF